MKKFIIGTNIIENCKNPISFMGKSLFSCKLEPEGIKISFNIEYTNTVIHLEDNRKVQGDFDFEIRQKSALILIQKKKIFELKVEDSLAIIDIDLRPLGLHIYTDQSALYVGGAQLSGNIIKNCTNGIAIGD